MIQRLRFLTRYGADLKRVAAALVWTLDGIPCLYTGKRTASSLNILQTPNPISFIDRDWDYYRSFHPQGQSGLAAE